MSKKSRFEHGAPLPKSVGRCADEYHEVKELRLAMDKEVAEVKRREKELLDHMLDNLSASDDTGASGLRYRAQVITSEEPTVNDWELVHDYVHEHDRFDLLGKTIAKKAVKEMLEDGRQIPGIGKITVKKLSITKLK